MRKKAKIFLVIGLVVAIAYIVFTIMKKASAATKPIDPYTIAQNQIAKLNLSAQSFAKGYGSNNTIIDLGARANTVLPVPQNTYK
jgi:hypothetical protein